MKFSEQWLREWVNPAIDTLQLANQLTMAGLEVDSVSPVANEFSKVVVGEVIECEKHPDAKRLHVCQVDIGEEKKLNIVCGGVNVRVGIKVPVALIGARLSKDIKIKKTKLRGVVSEGMICAARELGIEDQEEKKGSIMELPHDAPIGMDFREYLTLNDQVIDIELTPNRGDCLSILGIAREVGLINRLPIHSVDAKPISAKIKDTFPVRVMEKKACPRYVGRVIRHISTDAKTPLSILEKLRRSGIRGIHPVVDICNYVMLELGQPMHAFDLDRLDHEIQVRFSHQDEKIKLIDGNEIQLKEKTLVIADKNQAQAIAGIMGAEHSMVGLNTKDIFLESAFFDPVHILMAAKQLGLQTDSSYRFERGVDFNLQQKAIERASELILSILGGEAGPIIEVCSSEEMPKEKKIILRKAQVKRILGIDIEGAEVTRILESLGMPVEVSSDVWKVSVPSFRSDISLEIDLIEELARIVGYDHIPARHMTVELTMPSVKESQLKQSRISQLLVDKGYYETINYSFIDPEYFALIENAHSPITLTNPMTPDMSIMRPSLWPGLLKTLIYNLNRQAPQVRLFELGQCFLDKGDDQWLQFSTLAMLLAGSAYPEQWGLSQRSVDFYDLKNDVESILSLTGDFGQFQWKKGTHPALHPGQSSDLYQKDRIVGYLGQLHPKISQHLDLNQVPYLFEIQLDAIETRKIPRYLPVSKFPAIRRDIAIVVDKSVSAKAILQNIEKEAGNLLNKVQIFDIYQGEGVEESKKSVALGLIFRNPVRTLTDDEINAIIQDVVAKLNSEFNAKLRT